MMCGTIHSAYALSCFFQVAFECKPSHEIPPPPKGLVYTFWCAAVSDTGGVYYHCCRPGIRLYMYMMWSAYQAGDTDCVVSWGRFQIISLTRDCVNPARVIWGKARHA